MKLTTLLLIIALLQVSAAGYSQITLKEKKASLEKVLNAIENQSKYVFLYDANDLKIDNITINVKNATIEETLKQCFQNVPVEYTIEQNNVLLKTKQPTILEKIKAIVANIDVHGRVVDETGQPLPSATIRVKDGTQSTTADANGYFNVQQVDPNSKLIISFIGFENLEIAAKAEMGTIQLKQAESKLDEVKVIAYGTTTERLSTGDVTSVRAADIEMQPVNNPILALEGRVPGMFIRQENGLPGAATTVTIRGGTSISNGSDPLYIVDGVPYPVQSLPSANIAGPFGNNSGNPFSLINSSDIESISVLKDADATAIYGSRGANGVVLITTKKGKAGDVRVDVNLQSGIGQVGHYLKLLSTPQYLQMRHEAFVNDKTAPNPNADYDLTLWDTTRNTNWQKILMGRNAHYTDDHVTISGGNGNTQFLIGAGYHRETTVSLGDFADTKASVNFNINSSSANRKFKVSLSGFYTVDNNLLNAYNFTLAAVQLPPDAPSLYSPDGSINWAPNAQGVSSWPAAINNPAATLLVPYNTKFNTLNTSAFLSYEIMPGFTLKGSLGYSNIQNGQILENPLAAIDPSARSVNQAATFLGNSNMQSWIIEPQLTYTKQVNSGILSALFGMTIEQNNNNNQTIVAHGYSNDLSLSNLGAATTLSGGSTSSIYKYAALYAKLNYNIADEYLLNLTGRRDGSSRFGPANRFANFYAVGAAWVFSKENYIKKQLPFLSFGKLRASYGITGNDQVGDYSYLDLYQTVAVNVPYQGITGIAPQNIYTPDLRWELTRKLEAGVEFGFLKDRIMLNISGYLNRSSNQLLGYALPTITGFSSVERNLPALLQNEGLEVEINTINVKNTNFQWSSSFNVSSNRSTLLAAASGVSADLVRKVGYSPRSVFLYHFTGVDPITGTYTFASSKGGSTSTPNPSTDENTIIDPTPKFYGSLQNSFSYKNFQLSFSFQFVKTVANIYTEDGIPGSYGSLGGNEPVSVLSRWQKPGDVTNIPRFSQNGSTSSNYAAGLSSDLVYGDASYIRLKNASLSWQIPTILVRKIKIQSAQIFVQGQNLLTFTKYPGFDPENLNTTSLPPLRVITLGIKAAF